MPHTTPPLTTSASCACSTVEHSGSEAQRLPHSQLHWLTPQTFYKLHLHFFCVHRRFFPLLIFSYFLQCLITCAKKAEQEKTDNETQRRKMPNQSKPPPYPHTISASCSPIKLNLVTCSCVPQKLEEINSNANEKTHNLLSAEECMLH